VRLILFRHGPAGQRDASRWPDDSQRPLTTRGLERTRRAAGGLARIEPGIHAILTSPCLRAEATAKLLADALGSADVQVLEALRPGGSVRQVITQLQDFPTAAVVVLVGHEPDLGRWAGMLVFGVASQLPLKKAGACEVRFEGAVTPGRGQLAWLVPPRFLRRRAGRDDKVCPA